MIDISEEAVDALCLRLVVNDDYDTLVAVQALRAALDEAEARARYAETDAGYLRAQSKELRAHWNQAEARATHWHDGWKRAMGEFDAKCKEANEQRARAERMEAALRVIAGNNCITCSADAFSALFAEKHPSAAHLGAKP